LKTHGGTILLQISRVPVGPAELIFRYSRGSARHHRPEVLDERHAHHWGKPVDSVVAPEFEAGGGPAD
jgi:hypothetical protein